MRKFVLLFFAIISFNYLNFAQQSLDFPTLTGQYLGQKPPGIIPEIFAPNIICTGMIERDITISKDGKEIYYSFSTGKVNTIMFTQLKNDKWTEPEIASFALDQNFYYFEPCLSFDNTKIYFLTTHPSNGEEPKPRWTYQNIWVADRKSDGTWSEPHNIDSTINGNKLQYYPSLTYDGTMYFSRTDPQSKKNFICRSRQINGKYTEPEILPSKINQDGTTPYNAYISPDESFLIVCINGLKNDINQDFANYYIFFRDENDNWSDAISFGPEVNVKGSNAISASISPDGKYLFFAAKKINPKFGDINKIRKLNKILELANNPQNNNYDIYWVDARIIQNLKQKIKK